MARKRRPAIQPTKELEHEIRNVVAKYVEYNKSRKKFNWSDFFNESDVSKTLWSKMVKEGRHSITLDSAVRLLDSVGMKLAIVPKGNPGVRKRIETIMEHETGT